MSEEYIFPTTDAKRDQWGHPRSKESCYAESDIVCKKLTKFITIIVFKMVIFKHIILYDLDRTIVDRIHFGVEVERPG